MDTIPAGNPAHEEDVALALQAQEEVRQGRRPTPAFEKLLDREGKRVYGIIRRYRAVGYKAGLQEEDLLALARMGFFKALLKFNISQGWDFGAYMGPWIQGAIVEGIRKQSPGGGFRMARRKIAEARFGLTVRHGHHPTIEELAKATGFSPRKIRRVELSDLPVFPLSLDEAADTDGMLLDGRAKNGADHVEQTERERSVRGLLDGLSNNERTILELYYFEDIPHPMIAEMLGLGLSESYNIRYRAQAKIRKQLA